MRIIYNPNPPDGALIHEWAYRGKEEKQGFYYSVPTGRALRYRDDVAEALLKQFPFLREIDEDGTILRCDGYKVVGNKLEDEFKIEDFTPKKKVPNLIERSLHPQVEEEETEKPDFYGEGLEEDSGEGFSVPKSKFSK